MSATVVWVILVVASALLGAEVVAWSTPIQHALLRRAAAALPEHQKARYLEEWLAELDAQPKGPVTRFVFAVSLLVRCKKLARALEDIATSTVVQQQPDVVRDDASESGDVKPGLIYFPAEKSWVVREALDSLPPKDRKMLVERVLNGHTVSDVADKLGISSEDVRKSQHRALSRLRRWVRSR